MKTIISPTDYSVASLNAVNYAADLALATGSNLLLVHIFQIPAVYGEIPVAADSIDEQVKSAEALIKSIATQVTQRTGDKLTVNTDVTVGGDIVTEIAGYCRANETSFVVMGSQGGGAMARALFGSNTITAMKKLQWPLIVVPPQATFKKPSRIGFACDFKNVVDTTPVQEVRSLVSIFKPELHVIHINTDDETNYPPEIIEESGLLQEMFDEFHPVYHFMNNVKVDDGLSDYAEKHNLDLLIVIPKKHSFIDKLFHKSHTKQLIVHTHVPVLSIHE